MAQQTYRARAIVLRKTKLGESDLICTMLAEDGSQLRAVAKGARKPASPFASRLELYAVADVLLARGRSLDIVKEARLVEGNGGVRTSMERAAGAAPMAELLDRIAHPGLAGPQLFPLTQTALAALGASDAAHVPAICAAHLLKAFAFSGLRPSLISCAVCGSPVDAAAPAGQVPFSCTEGGVVCAACRQHAECQAVPAAGVVWAQVLLGSTFARIAEFEPNVSASFAALHLCQQWALAHVGSRLRSLEFLFACGLF